MSELREALEAAVEQQETVQPETPQVEGTTVSAAVESASVPEQAPPESAPEAPDAEPKPDGKPAAPATPPDSDAAPQEAAASQEARLQHRVDRAPVSWKGQARSTWNSLPLEVRQEVHRIETSMQQQVREHAEMRKEIDAFRQTVAPFSARLQATGMNPVAAAGKLLQSDYILSSAPRQQRAEYMAQLIKDYDIDIEALDNALVGRTAPAGPPNQQDINTMIQQRVQQALAPLYQQQQAAQQRIQEQIYSEVERMSLDPRFPYFDEVREEMADIMDLAKKRGVEMNLEEAYMRAVAFHPGAQAAAQSASQHSQAQSANQRAQAALRASSSVSGAPAGNGSTHAQSDGTLRGDIMASMTDLRIQ